MATRAEEAEGLVATLPDGSRVDLDPTEVECVPSEEDPDVEVLRIVADLEGARLIIQAVPTDDATSFNLPLDAGDFESGPENLQNRPAPSSWCVRRATPLRWS